jgi:hypothetical protein
MQVVLVTCKFCQFRALPPSTTFPNELRLRPKQLEERAHENI